MGRKRKLSLLVLYIVIAAAVVHARPASPNTQLRETSELVLRSNRAIQTIESHLIALYDLAKQSAYGSYSAAQREQMNAEFQTLLPMIDQAVNQTSLKGLNMLNSENEIIAVKTHGQILQFPCVDITLAGLNLNGDLDISHPQGVGRLPNGDFYLIPGENANTAFYSIEAAVRRIKEVDLLFTGYINTVSMYVRGIRPIPNKEALQALEKMEASKEAAKQIVFGLSRAIDLTGAVQTGTYSEAQMTIMNAEFEERLNACTDIADRAYYGMGMIDSTNIFTVNTDKGFLEFACFDLTKEGLGLDLSLSIETPDATQEAYPHIVKAFQSAVKAMISLDDDMDALSEEVH